jgi:predicted Zn-dependent protease
MAHLQQGRQVQAEAVFRNLLAERPMHAAAHHFLGAALYAQGRLEEARIAMRESLRRKARYKPWIENLIHCEQALGNQSEVQRLRGLLAPQVRADGTAADPAPAHEPDLHSGAYPVTSASKGWG